MLAGRCHALVPRCCPFLLPNFRGYNEVCQCWLRASTQCYLAQIIVTLFSLSTAKQLYEARRADLLGRAETLEERIREMEMDSQRQVAEAKAVAEER